MQPSCARRICRSRNPFTPSLVLWQHFVVADAPVRPILRLASSASPAAETSNLHTLESNGSPPPSAEPPSGVTPAFAGDAELAASQAGSFTIRRVQQANPFKIRKVEHTGAARPGGGSMTAAQRAVKESGDYTGKVVRPIVPPSGAQCPDYKLPWYIPHELKRHRRLGSSDMKKWVLIPALLPAGGSDINSAAYRAKSQDSMHTLGPQRPICLSGDTLSNKYSPTYGRSTHSTR